MDSLLDPAVRFEAVATRVVRLSTSCMSTPTCAFDQMTYEDLVGSCLLTLLPGHVGTGLLEMCAHIVDTGEPLILDDYQLGLMGGQQSRFDIPAERVGDGLTYTWRDVTDRHLQALHNRCTGPDHRAVDERDYRHLLA